MTQKERKELARQAYRNGWSLTPLDGKRPTLPGWQEREPPSEDEVVSWVEDGNVGLRTGSMSGVVVVDVDKGGDLEAVLDTSKLKTLTVKTPGGGRHFYFQAPENMVIGNSAGKVGKHIDIRGEGGQVVFPGSEHPNGGTYTLTNGGLDSPLAPLPAEILLALEPKKPKNLKPPITRLNASTDLTEYGRQALDRELKIFAGAEIGERNHQLNRSAFALGQLCEGGVLDAQDVAARLLSQAEWLGLSTQEAMRTIESGMMAGAEEPRGIPTKVRDEVYVQPQEKSVPLSDETERPNSKFGLSKFESDLFDAEQEEDDEPLNEHAMAGIMTRQTAPIDYAIENLLAAGDLCYIIGESGTGKSTILIDLALSLASQGKFLGFLQAPKKPQRVAILDEENNEAISLRRIQKHLRGRGLNDDDLKNIEWIYLYDNGIKIDEIHNGQPLTAKAKKVLDRLDDFKPDWIFLDSMARFHTKAENDNGEMARFISENIKPLMHKYKCGFVILHHVNKTQSDKKKFSSSAEEILQKIRGAGDIRNAADTILVYDGDIAYDKRQLSHMKFRAGGETHIPIEVNYTLNDHINEPWCKLLGGTSTGALENSVIEALDRAGAKGVERVRLIAECESQGHIEVKRSMKTVLGKLHGTYRVKRRKTGKYSHYWLAMHAPEGDYDD